MKIVLLSPKIRLLWKNSSHTFTEWKERVAGFSFVSDYCSSAVSKRLCTLLNFSVYSSSHKALRSWWISIRYRFLLLLSQATCLCKNSASVSAGLSCFCAATILKTFGLTPVRSQRLIYYLKSDSPKFIFKFLYRSVCPPRTHSCDLRLSSTEQFSFVQCCSIL